MAVMIITIFELLSSAPMKKSRIKTVNERSVNPNEFECYGFHRNRILYSYFLCMTMFINKYLY